jgi:hypothetical protein
MVAWTIRQFALRMCDRHGMVRTLVVVAVIASCKGGDGSGASSDDPWSGSPKSGSPSSGERGKCKDMPKLCTKLPAAELAKLFEVPDLVTDQEENSPAYAAGSRALCRYRKDGDTTNLRLVLILECSNLDAEAEYAGLKKAVGSIDTMEDLPGLGDEAWWVTRGAIKARKGPIIVDVVYDYYHIDGKMPAAAKPRAIDVANRLFAAAP